jgi:hypothetical protein
MKQAGLMRKWPVEPNHISIKGAGHMPQVEAPKEFVEAVKTIGGATATT